MSIKVSRESAITALVTYPKIKDAAAACGISEKTLHAWLNDKDFAEKLKMTQDIITRRAIDRVLLSVNQALDVLQDIMTDKENNASPRVTAAKAILDHALKVYELQTVQQRLDALERRLNV